MDGKTSGVHHLVNRSRFVLHPTWNLRKANKTFLCGSLILFTFSLDLFYFAAVIRDWKDSYRMLFVVAYRIWDEDACKSWRNKFALDLEPRGRCLVSILVVQSCVR